MKTFLRPVVCAGALAALMCVPSLAAEPEGIPMLVNGEAVAFPDAVPTATDTIDVPAVASFQALGFEITWDEASQTITAVKGDRTVTLTIGSDLASWSGESWMEVSEDGSSASAGASGGAITLSKAPYVDPATWRTYIAAQDLAPLLGEGYQVAVEDGWVTDSAGGMVISTAEMAVIVDDLDTIWAANTETYQLMDQYTDYARKYSEGNWRIGGAFALEVLSEGERLGLDGDYSMLTNETALQLDADLAVDLPQPEGGMAVVLPDVDVALRCDVETGMFYFQSQAISASDTWYSVNMKELYDAMYGPGFYDAIIALDAESAEMTFGESLEAILRSGTMPLSREFTTRDYLALFNSMFADSAFEKTGSTYTSTPIDLTQDGVHVLMQVVLPTSGGRVNGYGVEMTVSQEEEPVMSMDVSMKGNQMDMEMTFQVPEVMTMTMTMDGTYQSTSAAPATQPPAGAAVVDLMEALTQAAEAAQPQPEPAPAPAEPAA